MSPMPRLWGYCLAAAAIVAAGLAMARPWESEAAGKFKIITVNVAADSAPARPAASPGNPSERWVHFSGTIEYSSPIDQAAVEFNAFGKLPGALDGPVTIEATPRLLTFDAKLSLPPSCTKDGTWLGKTLAFQLEHPLSQNLPVLQTDLFFSLNRDPTWQITFHCPAGDVPIAEHAVRDVWDLAMQPFRAGPGYAFSVSVSPPGELACITRRGNFGGLHESGVGNAKLRIVVRFEVIIYRRDLPGDCLIPLNDP